MNRQEDFKQASQSLEVQVISNPWTLFEKGAEHGYQYAVEKACEVIAKLYPQAAAYYEQPENFVEEFRKAMEE